MMDNKDIMIQKGIPLPRDVNGHRRVRSGVVTAFRKMDVGDSCLLDHAIHKGIYTCAKFVGIRIISKRIDDATIRVWRVE